MSYIRLGTSKITRSYLTISLSLLLLFIAGCADPSPSGSTAPPTSKSTSAPLPAGKVHIEMPVRDMAIEMQQHCTAASNGFQKVKAKIDEALLHGGVDEVHYKIRKLSPELKTVQESIEKCEAMAHGIYEKSVGVEPPK